MKTEALPANREAAPAAPSRLQSLDAYRGLSLTDPDQIRPAVHQSAEVVLNFATIMIVQEAKLNFQLIRYGDDEPLTNTKRLLTYLTTGIAEDAHESFWIVCMNPKRRPICRMRMAAGPCVAATVGVRQIIRAMILSEAMAVACLRTERASIPRPNLADARLL